MITPILRTRIQSCFFETLRLPSHRHLSKACVHNVPPEPLLVERERERRTLRSRELLFPLLLLFLQLLALFPRISRKPSTRGAHTYTHGLSFPSRHARSLKVNIPTYTFPSLQLSILVELYVPFAKLLFHIVTFSESVSFLGIISCIFSVKRARRILAVGLVDVLRKNICAYMDVRILV